MLSPIIVGGLVLKNATAIEEKIMSATDISQKELLLNELAHRVITPYIIITVVLIIMAIMITKSSLPEIASDKKETEAHHQVLEKASVFQYPHLMLGVLCLFLYVGVEVMAGDAIGTYGKHMGMPLDQTKYFTAFTLFAMLAGYVIGIFTIPKFISQQKALAISAILGVIFTTGVFVTTGYTSITFIALLGLANALMWPAIFPPAIDGLGSHTKFASALLIMGIAGGAIIPLVYTNLRDTAHLSNSLSFFTCMLPCYIYIFYYAVKGYRVGKPFALVAA